MATQTRWVLVDDLDGSRASGTVEFGLGRESYAIDLSEENAARLRAVLGEFVAAARVKHDAPTAALRRSPRSRAAVAAPVVANEPAPSVPSLRGELGEIVRGLTDDLWRLLFEILAALADVLRGRQAARRVSGDATGAVDGRG
ncbi:hypothetical protein BJF90_21900 [Pseudonocardia sp. CNS-004]|nr:hypothetical protein BJF90_21900 [Pseudonocardia sp. CNS-004]